MSAFRRPCRFRREQRGAAIVEFSIVVFVLLLLVGGIIDFSLAYFQWNSASKALYHGARMASVSDSVAIPLRTLTGLESGALPGDPMPTFHYVCSGKTASCTPGGTAAYSAAAMDKIVRGRDNTCGAVEAGGIPGMCDIFSRIGPQNVTITYAYTGLGFAGRPKGPVPTITIELTEVRYDYLFLRGLFGPQLVNMPPMRTAATGEDMRGCGENLC